MTDFNPDRHPDLLQASARAQHVLRAISEKHLQWWCLLDEVDVFSADPDAIVELLRTAPTDAAATYIYGLYQGRSEIAHMTGRPLWPGLQCAAPSGVTDLADGGLDGAMWAPDPASDPAFEASARARQAIDTAARTFPDWWALVDDTDAFSAPREDLLDALQSAPTDAASTYVLAFVQARAELAHITGRPLI